VDDTLVFSLVDATGNGVCRLQSDGSIATMSERFLWLTGLTEAARGRRPEAVLLGIPPEHTAGATPVRRVGKDGVSRELSARVWGEPPSHVLVLDHSGLARLQRQQVRLDREVADLKAELELRERAPVLGLLRDASTFAIRLHEATSRAARYGHTLSVLWIQCDAEPEAASAVAEAILDVVRGVDEVGQGRPGCWAVLLPHTDLAGARIAAERIRQRVLGTGVRRVAVGAAQWRADEAPKTVVARAEDASAQAFTRDAGVLLAVDVV
jgi:GGDEF domain-containing protein